MARFDDIPRASSELSPAEKFRVACDLSDAAARLVRARFRRENPAATDDEIAALVQEWLETRPGAEAGDGVGRAVAWPRARRSEPR